MMTAEKAAALRKPFPPAVVGKLPRITCTPCGKARERVCSEHHKARCEVCNAYITTRHIHLDFVGHAEVTDRLLSVDPLWTWEPMAFDADDGLPSFDQHGGLWMRLTVLGVTRIGYGAAEGKTGPDAIKEVIGDGIRNSAMRFGVGIDLWGAHGVNDDEHPNEPPSESLADKATGLRKRIAMEAQAKGYALDDVPAMFAARMQGREIGVAAPAVLAEFLADVRRWKPVEGAV